MINIHRSFISVVSVSLVLIILALGFFVFKARVAQGEGATQANQDRERITLHATGRGNPWINLLDGRDLPTVYTGAANLAESLNQSRPLALAADDFDEDGVPDLISGYAGPEGGILTLHRGNEDSIFPNNPEAQQRKAAGTFTDSPFLPQARVFAMPEAPDFLGTGDFDNDGHWDVVAAARGSNALYLLPGDGRGELRQAQRVDLPGRVTALVIGEINRRDGLADIAVGIVTDGGPQVMIFESPEGALRGQPEAIGLPAEATALALGQLDEDYPLDLAVAAGSELVVVHGRDRKLSLDEASQAEVPQASISRFSFPFAIASMAVGDFSGQHRMEIALLSADGEVHLLKDRAASGTSQASERVIAGQSEMLAAGSWPQATRLVCANVSGLPRNDLVVVDSANRQLHILAATPADNREAKGRENIKNSAEPLTRRAPVSLDVEGEPIAVLPMRLNVDALNDLVVLKASSSGLTVAMTAQSATYIVNSSGDGPDCSPFDGVCSTGTYDPQTGRCNLTGQCTLPAAIQQADYRPGTYFIRFNEVPIVNLSGDLGQARRSVVIDGTTSPTGRVVLNGGGLAINGGSSVVRAVTITGITPGRNGGIDVGPGGNLNLIESCFISGGFGINVSSSNNTIGGTTEAARNVITGTPTGILVLANQNLVIGNHVLGSRGSNNAGFGILLAGSNNVIGGTSPDRRNVISGSAQYGVIDSGTSIGNLVQGNFIGTDVTGKNALGNGQIDPGLPVSVYGGIAIGGTNNTIGGTAVGARNIISANKGFGVALINNDAPGNIVQGNFIGTDVAGLTALGNTYEGILITAPDNTVVLNTIAFNNREGVNVTAGTRNKISQNSIFSNGRLGIDLGFDRITPNDLGDNDSGANDLQNFPVLNAVTRSSSSTTIQGTLNSKPSGSFTLEFFSNTTCDPSGNGEGERFIGSATVTTNSSGNVSFNTSFPTPVPSNQFITATATDSFGNTSEFSRCFPALGPNRPPMISAVSPLTRQQGSPASNSIIANVSDPDQAANTLTVTVNGAASATVNGVTVSGISIDPAGVVTANVVASCTATNASFTLRVTDSGGLFSEASLNVTVTANTPPTLSYNNASVPAGGSIMVSPAAASDNGSITGYSIVRVIPQLNPPPTVNSSGKVSITNAPISGTYNITVRATDNCGATTDATLMLTAQITGEVTGGLLYVLSDRTSGNQIYGYTVDETTGALTLLAGFPISTGGNGDGTSFFSGRMTIDRTNHRLYAVNEGSKTVSAYAINTRTGVLTPLPFSPINVGMGNFLNLYFTVAVYPSGSPLVVGNGNNYQIASYRITETTATPAPGSPYSTDFASPSSIAFSQEGDYVYTGGFAGNAFAGFRVNATTGELTALARPTSFESGMFFPRAYATDAAGRLFMANLLGQTRVFTTANGIPSPVSGNPFASGLTQCVHGLLHPNGFYLVADSVGNRVGVYRINGNGSATTLTRVTGSPFAAGGSGTNVLALNQAGTLLIAANGDSRNLTTFSVDPETGELTSRGTQPANTLGTSGKLSGLALSTSLEADVAPRANGNGQLTVADWIQTGRYAAGLDVEALGTGNAFQRADCAPRLDATGAFQGGNGELTVADWVQAGLYAAGLAPVTPADGPTAPNSSAVSTALMQTQADAIASGPRTVRVISASLERGRRGTVTIELDAQGDENALSFSLNFDPAQLQFVSAAVGNGASSATLNLNTSQATNGRVGLALALPAGQVMAVGLRSIVTVTFDAPSSGSAASTTIGFGDQPIRREVSDAAANSLPTTFTSGTVTFTGTGPGLAVTSISPASPTASSTEQSITVNGSGFQSGLTVTVTAPNGSQSTLSGAQIQNVTATSFVMRITLNVVGNWSLRANNPDGGQSNTFSFTVNPVNNPAPTLASLSPASTTAGGAAFTLTVTGTNFTSSSVVRWNGSDRLTTFVSSTRLTAAIPASDIAAAGTASVTVFNPPPGSGLSNPMMFTITPPAPPEPEQEPNETTAQANPLAISGGRTGSVAVGDATGIVLIYNNGDRDGIEDFFVVTLTQRARLDLTLTFSNPSADLDLFLLNIGGLIRVLGASNGPSTTTERILSNILEPGRYYVGVSAFRGSSSYTLTAAQAETQIEIIPPNPTANDQITVRLSSLWPNTCVPLNPSSSVVGNEVQIITSNPDQPCDPVITPWSLSLPIGRLAAGVYQLIATHTSSSGQTELGRRGFSVAIPLSALATNRSTTTQCAEEDNIKVDFVGRVLSYVIEATHPAYAVGTDNCAPNFSNCGSQPPGFPFTPGVFKLFDDGETVLEAVREASWWRPNGMTAAVDGNAPANDIHYIRIYRRIAGTSEYPQFLVLYMDGNLRLIPHPPTGASSVCFGSSVIVGPAALAPRPIAEIASVTYFPRSGSLEIKYKDGGAASILLQEVNRGLARVQVVVNHPTDALPFATFRSMYVADDNADVSRVKWLDIFGVLHDDPILTFQGGQGTEWLFYRGARSGHNTSAPDIRIRLESRP